MSIQIVNKGIDVSPALRDRITDRVLDGIAKYFDRPGEAYVVVERDGAGFSVHCSLHLPTGTMLQTSASSDGDAYLAADQAMEKLETRLRRYKRKLRGHHKGKGKRSREAEEAMYAVLQAGRTPSEETEGSDDDSATPEAVVVSERMGEVRTMTVSMAVLDMDISEAQVVLFRNIANGEINVLYRRPDGHIGWMNPQKNA